MNVNAIKKLDKLISPVNDNLTIDPKLNTQNITFIKINTQLNSSKHNLINDDKSNKIILKSSSLNYDVKLVSSNHTQSIKFDTKSNDKKLNLVRISNESKNSILLNKKSILLNQNTKLDSLNNIEKLIKFKNQDVNFKKMNSFSLLDQSSSKETNQTNNQLINNNQTSQSNYRQLDLKQSIESESEKSKEESVDELEIEFKPELTGKCITNVKIRKLDKESIKNQQQLKIVDQLIDNKIFLNNSSTKQTCSSRLLKSKILNKDNFFSDVDENNQQVNEYYSKYFNDEYDNYRIDKINFSISKILNNNKQNRLNKLTKLNNSIEQVNNQNNSIVTNKNFKLTNHSNNYNNNMNDDEEQYKLILEELANTTTNTENFEFKNQQEKKKKNNNKKQTKLNEVNRFYCCYCCWVDKEGGLNSKRNQVDSYNKKLYYSYNKLLTKATGKLKNNSGTCSGEKLKKTAGKTVKFEPFLKHLANDDEKNKIYQCLILNHHSNKLLFNQLVNQLRINKSFLNYKSDYRFLNYYSDQNDNQINLIKQTNEFVTIIKLDFNNNNITNENVCKLDYKNCVNLSDNLINFLNNNNDKMYHAISGIPNGLNQSKSSTSLNYLPTLGNITPASSSSILNNNLATSSAIIMNTTSVVPVVVSSVINPAILNQNVHFITEKVQIFRQPGEKLGMALNFNEDSTNSDQKIERVFIQNVNLNSPASRAKCERDLGYLKENDEILCIENRPVNTMSRLDCVECLREAGQCINLLVRGARVLDTGDSTLTRTTTTFENQQHNSNSTNNINCIDNNSTTHQQQQVNNNSKRPPPIIPPRLSTTVLTSVQKDKICNDKQQNANLIKNSSSLTNGSTINLKRPRRPSVQPPLPPRKIVIASSSVNDDEKTSVNNSNNELNEYLKNEINVSVNSELNKTVNVLDNNIINCDNNSLNENNKSIVTNESSALNSNCSLNTSEKLNEDNQKQLINQENDLKVNDNLKEKQIIIEQFNDNSPKELNIKLNELNDENNTIIDNQQLKSIQYQSNKQQQNSISYATNISTSSLQLMNNNTNSCLINTTNTLNCINSSSSTNEQQYLDLINQQQQNNFESESDDTESSLSTVIERFSRTSTANSSFSGHQLLTNSDQNRDLQLVNIEKVLNSFEFLEQELDRQEMNYNKLNNNEIKKEQQRKISKNLFDNLITSTTNMNKAPINKEQEVTITNQIVNKSKLDKNKIESTKVINYLQRDLTLLTSSNEQTPSSSPKIIEVNLDNTNLDDYDDIQTVAANCNVTEYFNSENSITKATALNISSENMTNNNLNNSLTRLTNICNSDNTLNNKIKLPVVLNKDEITSSLSPIKDNKFVKEDCKNNSNKIKKLFRPVKISLKDKEKKQVKQDEKQNTLTKTDLTTDLIKKENKEQKKQKDDSQIILTDRKTEIVEEVEKREDKLMSKIVVVKSKLVKKLVEEKVELSEKKTKANDQLDHLIGLNLKTKIDSENNRNLVIVKENENEKKKKTDNYNLDQIEINLVKNNGDDFGIKNLEEKNENGQLELTNINEKCIEKMNYNMNKTPVEHSNEHNYDQQKIINQINLNTNTSLDDDKINSDNKQQQNQRQNITKQKPIMLNDDHSIVTPIKLENKTELKLDKKSNQNKIKITKDKLITNQVNHASKTTQVRRTSLNNGLNNNLKNGNQNVMPLVKTTTTRPKIIELTKSTLLKNINNTNVNLKLKRTSNDQSNNTNSNDSNLNKKNLTVATANKNQTQSNNVINNCNNQTANKNINQIKNKTMTSTLKRIINRTVDTVQNSSTTINNSVNNAINNKSTQLKTNSIKTNANKKVKSNKITEIVTKTNNNKELDQSIQQINTLKKSNRKTNLNKFTNNNSNNILSTSSSAASSTNSSSINLVALNNSLLNSRSNSQLSISNITNNNNNNQVKVNRSSSSLTLQRTSSLKQQISSNAFTNNNNQLPRRSKSISVNSLTTTERDKPSLIPKVKSKEDVHQQQKDNLQSKDGQLLKNSEYNRENKENKSNVKKMNDDENKLIQVTDQNQILINEKGELFSTDSNYSIKSKQNIQSDESNQSNLESNVTSPNINNNNKMDSTTINNDNLIVLSTDIKFNDSNTTSQPKNSKVQCSTDKKNSELQINDKLNEIDNVLLNVENVKLINNQNLINNQAQLNKSEINYLTKQSNSKINLIVDDENYEYLNNKNSEILDMKVDAQTNKKFSNITKEELKNDCMVKNEGGVNLVKNEVVSKEIQSNLDGGAQHQKVKNSNKQNISRKEKLSQFKSNDQQVKQQINELIECVKKSEFLLSQTIDCEPLTIEIFDDIEVNQSNKLFNNYDLQCESTNELSSNDQKSDNLDNNLDNNMLLFDQPQNQQQQQIVPTLEKDQTKIMKNVNNNNSTAGAKFNKIVNNKVLNSSKSSDLGGSSSAASSSDESTSKSPNELDVETRVCLTRKDSVSSSSSSICSSSGSSSGVSSSHSGQYNHVNSSSSSSSSSSKTLKNKQQTTNDLLLLQTTNNTTETQWIKNKQQTKCSPTFKRIEQKIDQIDFKNNIDIKINNEQLINNVIVNLPDNHLFESNDLRKYSSKENSLASLYYSKNEKKISNNYLYSPTEYKNSKKQFNNKDNLSDSEKSEELSIAPAFSVESSDKLFNFCEFKARDFQLARLASNSSTTSPCSLSSSTFSNSSNHHQTNQLDQQCTTSLVKQRQKQMEQLAAAQLNNNNNNQTGHRLRSLSSRELSINSCISSNSTSGDEESSSKQNFRAIIEQWKKRTSTTDLNNLINSMNNTSLTSKVINKINKLNNKDTVKNGIYSSESELNQQQATYSNSIAAVIQNFNQNSMNQPPALPPKPTKISSTNRSIRNNIGMISNSFMQGASASTTALNTMNQNNTHNLINSNRKPINNSSINLNCDQNSDDKVFKLPSPKNQLINQINQDNLVNDSQSNKTIRSMSVSDICKVFEKQQQQHQNLTSSTNSTNSSNSQTSTSINQQEKIKINKNLEMRKRELFGDEITNTDNLEPKTKITKFANGNAVKNQIENLVSQYKAKSTSNLTDQTSTFNQKLNNSNLIDIKEVNDQSPIIKNENKIEKINLIIKDKSPNLSSNNLNPIEETKIKNNDECDSVFIESNQQKSPSKIETIINKSLNSVNREIEPQKLSPSTSPYKQKYTAEVLNELIDQASKSIEEELSTQNIKHTIEVIILQRESAITGSIGITLAGGADYESKEITIHKIINGGLAQRDGRIEKGDRILSINGILLKGKTHKEALEIMKTPTPEVVLVVFHNLSNLGDKHNKKSSSYSNLKLSRELNYSSKELSTHFTSSSTTNLSSSSSTLNQKDNFKIYKANLEKDGQALGFTLEGGKDSPLGDLPLTIKRIFTGGAADKEGTLMPGDEIICVNNEAVYNKTRTEAWNFLKKLPNGQVSLVIRRKFYNY